MERLEDVEQIEVAGNQIVLRPSIELTQIRSCLLVNRGDPVARAMILHPSVLASASRSSRQYQIRSALSALGSSEGDISKVIASVEKVIFAEATTHEVNLAVREYQERRAKIHPAAGPESLAISVADMPKAKKKIRLLNSGDLAYLLDVLLRRLSEGLDTQSVETDKAGRTEEEQIGQEETEPAASEQGTQPATSLSDREIAILVARKARALTRKMVSQLELAARDKSRHAGAVMQLIAVLALLRELRHLDKQKRWRSTWQPLVEERDRRYLLDESIKYLLGSTTHLIDVVDKAAGESTDEAIQLRVLLLWLAWDLGEELTEWIGQIWNAKELQAKLKANAAFFKLMPEVAIDEAACSDLKESIAKTVRETPKSAIQAANWFERHQKFGIEWANGFRSSTELRLGGFCRIPGNIDEPHVVVELTHNMVGFWDYNEVRRFERSRAVAVMPAHLTT
jgi:hypothetical protein